MTTSQTDQDAQAALLRVDDARYQAMMAADLPALERLLSPDLVYTHSNGLSDDKASFLEKVRSGAVTYQACRRETARFQRYGEAALLHGTVRLKAIVHGQQVELHNHYLTAWTLPDQGWQLRAWASTRIPDLS